MHFCKTVDRSRRYTPAWVGQSRRGRDGRAVRSGDALSVSCQAEEVDLFDDDEDVDLFGDDDDEDEDDEANEKRLAAVAEAHKQKKIAAGKFKSA